jgi:hypothetical protein
VNAQFGAHSGAEHRMVVDQEHPKAFRLSH